MSKRVIKIAAITVGAILAVGLIVLLVGPFLIPVSPLEGLATPQQVAPAESQFLTVPFTGTDGIDIHYLSDGSDRAAAEGDDAPTFVLLHGSLFNAFTWSEVMDFFAARGRVIAYDQIPYGLSEKLVAGDWQAENPYAGDAAVRQLFAFLDELDAGKVILVGNSYGGTLAVQATLAQPDRVDGLILVDAAVYVEEGLPAWLMGLPQVQRLGRLFARQLGRSEAFLRQTYFDPNKIDAQRMERTTIHTQVADWDEALWEYLQVWETSADTAARVGEIQQPTLVISGENDAIVPVDDSRRLLAELPNAELVILPACGHVPQEECPNAFEGAVEAWLAR